jgi:hypothetical protein
MNSPTVTHQYVHSIVSKNIFYILSEFSSGSLFDKSCDRYDVIAQKFLWAHKISLECSWLSRSQWKSRWLTEKHQVGNVRFHFFTESVNEWSLCIQWWLHCSFNKFERKIPTSSWDSRTWQRKCIDLILHHKTINNLFRVHQKISHSVSALHLHPSVHQRSFPNRIGWRRIDPKLSKYSLRKVENSQKSIDNSYNISADLGY